MVVLSIETSGCQPQTIVIGRRGTYETMQIAFDLTYLVENYGSGTAVLAVKRSQDTSAYPAVVTQEDNTLTWTVSETDTYYVGAGEAQLMWYVEGGLAKTIIYPMVVMRDILQTAEEPPDGYENWVEHLTGLGAETQQNAQNAAQSASEAEQAKDDAVDAKEASEEAARKAAAASVHAPIIQNGFWYIWSDDQYVNTNVRAEGEKGDKGDTGEKGDAGNGIESITKTGTSGLVDTYTVTYTDGTSSTFTVTNGAKGDKGDTGATGNGIASIEKTGTSGNVDTYTITYTNGQTVTFTVTNGAVSSVAGKTGAVVLDSGDIEYDGTETYQNGTAGAALSELNRQLSDVEENQIPELKDTLKFIANNLGISAELNPNVVDGKFVNATNNSIETSDNFETTDPIPVIAGQTISLTATGYNAVVGMIALCNSDNTSRTTVATSIDSTERTYTYEVKADGYIVCSYHKNKAHKLSVSIDYTSLVGAVALLDPQEAGTKNLTVIRYIDGKFVDTNGAVQSSSNFFISQSINLYKGQTINFTAKGYNTAVAMISLYDDGTYKPVVICTDSNSHTYSYTASEACVVRLSAVWHNATYSANIVTTADVLGAISALWDAVTPNPLATIEYPQMFTKIICMGDSLTVGYRGSGSDLATHNYPFYFEKLTGAEITTQANGGYTTKNFWSAYGSYDYSTFDCAVIYLGTNGGLTDTVDDDCDAEDYTQNADTNTGAYGKIIGHIKATAPHCKIFLVAGVNDYVRRATTMNPAVRSLAEFYDVGVADIENSIMADGGGGDSLQRQLYRPVDGIHYNTLGYMTMANMIYDAMGKFMSENRSMYKSNY